MDKDRYNQIRLDYGARTGALFTRDTGTVYTQADLIEFLYWADGVFHSYIIGAPPQRQWELSKEEWEKLTSRRVIKLASEGFCSLVDADDITHIIEQAGGKIISETDAQHTGTLAGPMREICYEFREQTWWAYVILHSMIDTYEQSWIVSRVPLNEDQAADKYEISREEERKRILSGLNLCSWDIVDAIAKEVGLK